MAKRGMLGPDKMDDAELLDRYRAACHHIREEANRFVSMAGKPKQMTLYLKQLEAAIKGLRNIEREQLRREEEEIT